MSAPSLMARAAAVVGAVLRGRSWRWPAVERQAFARDGYTCRACGRPASRVRLVGHHVKPYHLFPALELVIGNVLTLCQPTGGGCHLRVGHTDAKGRRGWKYWNPNAVADADAIRRRAG